MVKDVSPSLASVSITAQPRNTPSSDAADRAEQGHRGRLAPHHRPQLAPGLAHRPQQAQLPGPLVDRQGQRVGDAHQGDDDRQHQQPVDDVEQLVDLAGDGVDVLVLGLHVGGAEAVGHRLDGGLRVGHRRPRCDRRSSRPGRWGAGSGAGTSPRGPARRRAGRRSRRSPHGRLGGGAVGEGQRQRVAKRQPVVLGVAGGHGHAVGVPCRRSRRRSRPGRACGRALRARRWWRAASSPPTRIGALARAEVASTSGSARTPSSSSGLRPIVDKPSDTTTRSPPNWPRTVSPIDSLTEAPNTVNRDTTATPTISAEAVPAVRRGLRMALRRASAPGMPRRAAPGAPSSPAAGRATAGPSRIMPTSVSRAPSPVTGSSPSPPVSRPRPGRCRRPR